MKYYVPYFSPNFFYMVEEVLCHLKLSIFLTKKWKILQNLNSHSCTKNFGSFSTAVYSITKLLIYYIESKKNLLQSRFYELVSTETIFDIYFVKPWLNYSQEPPF